MLEFEKRLTFSEDAQDDSCFKDIQFYEVESDDAECGDESQKVYRDKLKEEKEQTSPHKAESFKIKWSFKRKKKKKLRLKTPQQPRKILLLGDMNCGKSNLITTYCKDRFKEQYFPTILHFCYSDAKAMGRRFELILADTPGREDYKPLRQCSYLKTDAAILCYSASDCNALEKICRYWLPELKEHAPNCPFVIAETKRDIRDDYEDKKLFLESTGKTESAEYRIVCREMEGTVPEGMGAQLARELGAQGFYSTSARYRAGTRGLFQGVTVVAVKKTRRKRRF